MTDDKKVGSNKGGFVVTPAFAEWCQDNEFGDAVVAVTGAHKQYADSKKSESHYFAMTDEQRVHLVAGYEARLAALREVMGK